MTIDGDEEDGAAAGDEPSERVEGCSGWQSDADKMRF